jgi:hypothetical protein
MKIGYRGVGHHRVDKIRDLFLDDIKWNIEDGVLYLLDERDSITHTITAIEVENNSVFLSGEVMGSYGRNGAVRMMTYERKDLGQDFNIVISSHVDYEESTLPRLIRSLDREGVTEDRVVVVVSGATGEITKEKGYTRIPTGDNLMGCTALSYLLKEDTELANYTLLLHDTCEVVSGFLESMGVTDIGLPYDIITAHLEIGLWSKPFIERLRGLDGLNLSKIRSYDIFNSLEDLCRLSCKRGDVTSLRSKDVYGNGVNRKVFEILGMGIKKYIGQSKTGGRP